MSLFVAFGAGLLSFLSPCVLPLVPVYLASLAGPEILEPQVSKFRMPVFLHSLSFVIGFSVVFSLWGAGAGLIGSALIAYSSVIRQVASGLLIAFGLFLLLAMKIPWLNFESRLTTPKGVNASYLRSFLIGSVFSFAWTPCVGPILGGILSLALVSETVWYGAYLLAMYSLGLGIPFLILGVAFGSIVPMLRRIHRYTVVIYIVSGVLLIAVGILVMLNRLIWF